MRSSMDRLDGKEMDVDYSSRRTSPRPLSMADAASSSSDDGMLMHDSRDRYLHWGRMADTAEQGNGSRGIHGSGAPIASGLREPPPVVGEQPGVAALTSLLQNAETALRRMVSEAAADKATIDELREQLRVTDTQHTTAVRELQSQLAERSHYVLRLESCIKFPDGRLLTEVQVKHEAQLRAKDEQLHQLKAKADEHPALQEKLKILKARLIKWETARDAAYAQLEQAKARNAELQEEITQLKSVHDPRSKRSSHQRSSTTTATR